ncbi:MAG TPA: 5'-methylthioadenosine/S-adenosylhomocysteine nucleosidase [Candidatus Saccharimonadales bacterium]|nr:5'-methylthioadenosine/S-adenosylhomocysteine nucleosidase [Candidatus Saccharimonadales bacterium]
MSASPENAERIGIMTPMPPEFDPVTSLIRGCRGIEYARRNFLTGQLNGRDVVAVTSGIGKANAADTAGILVDRFNTDAVVLTGVAASVHEGLSKGDIVVASELIYHDLIVPNPKIYKVDGHRRYPIPTDSRWAQTACRAAAQFFRESEIRGEVWQGLILTGDRYMREGGIRRLRQRFPSAIAVAMEDTSAGKACYDREVAFAAIRAISDSGSKEEFEDFVINQYSRIAAGIIGRLIKS